MKNAVLLFLSVMLNLYACSDNSDTAQQKQKEHVWKEQTDTLDKAKTVEGIIQESADMQQKQLQDETQ